MVRKGKVLLFASFVAIMFFILLGLSKSQNPWLVNIPMFIIVLRIILIVYALPYTMFAVSVLFRVKMYTESTSTTVSGQISSTGYINAEISEGLNPATASKFGLDDPSNHNKVFSYCFFFNVVLLGLLFVFGILPFDAKNSGQSLLTIITEHSVIMNIPFMFYFHNLIYVFILLGLLILVLLPFNIAKKIKRMPVLRFANMTFLALVTAGLVLYIPNLLAFLLK